MIRLGELLMREGLITASQLEDGLRRGVDQKVRLGTALVELGFVDVDTIARALSELHRAPAVLAKHVAEIDRSVVALFPPRLAEKCRAIPLGWTPTKPARLVVAFEDPGATPPDDLLVAAGARIEVGVAPELLVNRCLAKYYGVTRSAANMRFVDVDPAALRKPDSSEPPAPKVPSPELILSVPPLPGLWTPQLPQPEETQAEDTQPEDAQPEDTPQEEGGEPASLVPMLSADEAVVALKATSTSDEIGNILATWLHSTYGLGLVFVVKDVVGMAIGWRGWTDGLDQTTIEGISVPLGPPSMFTTVYEGKVAFRGPPPEEGAAIHRKVWTALGGEEPTAALVVPLMLGERVVNILYAHVTGDATLGENALEDVTRVALEATTAYARLIRRPKT
jgi:hypothetical protein